jgi:Mg-chelatase subunit ChlD
MIETTGPKPSSSSVRRRTLTYALLAGAIVAVVAAVGALRHRAVAGVPIVPALVVAPQPRAQAPRPRVELVFALDTTGSMSGLIEGAKRKIWSLASFVARGQPTPELRVGLVAYRDIGDEYVTRVYDLDDDLDRVYARLQQLGAAGGGDGPEHVARALHESVHRMHWTKGQSVKVIYLVGDAPPHTDYQDGFDLDAAAKAAGRQGITVHTIRCGNDPSTETAWRQVASLGHGDFLTIQQNGGMAEARTPYDAELGRLHDELSGTALGYGAAAPAMAASVATAAAAPAEAKAERAAYMATRGSAVAGAGDLVDDIAKGRVRLEAVPRAAMPPSIALAPPPVQRARIAELQVKRDELLKKITEASNKRAKFLDAKDKDADGFDAVAKRSLRKTVNDDPLSGLKL